jgi:hypothetical protein
LACETANPEPPVLASLSQALGPGGTVIVWYKTFEVTRNREMADRQPEYRPFLESINARVYDLMEIFSQGQYVDGNFRGSASLKNVLPAVVPNLDYERLPIREGTQAMLAWFQMAHVEPDAGKRAEIARDLLEYCHLDTLAMVRIWEFLGAL